MAVYFQSFLCCIIGVAIIGRSICQDGESLCPANVNKTICLQQLIEGDKADEFELLLIDKFQNNVNFEFNPGRNTLLHFACLHGSFGVIKKLIADELLLPSYRQQTNDAGETPLHLAASKGHAKAIELILEEATRRTFHKDVNHRLTVAQLVEAQVSSTLWTPLFYAAQANKNADATLSVLVDIGKAMVHVRDSEWKQPIHVALFNENFDAVRFFVNRFPELASSSCCEETYLKTGKTLSHLAAERGITAFLTEKKKAVGDELLFDPLAVDAFGQRPACLAAINGQIEFGKAMGMSFVDGDCVFHDHENKPITGPPLHAAIYYRLKASKYVDFLLEKKASVKTKNSRGGSILHVMAMSPGNKDDDKMLLEKLLELAPELLESTDVNGQTPFHVAVASSKLGFAKLLVEKNAKIDGIDANGYYALHLAEDGKMFDYLKKLAFYKGNLNLKTAKERQLTPLLVAALEGKLSIILYQNNEAGMDFGAVDAVYGRTIAHMAVEGGHTKPFEVLFQENPIRPKVLDLIKKRDKSGLTPLHLAVELNKTAIAKVFIGKTAVFNERTLKEELVDGSKNSLLHLAAKRDNADVIEAIAKRVDLSMTKLLKSVLNAAEKSTLHMAAEYGSVGVINKIRALVTDAAELDLMMSHHDIFMRTALHCAVTQCHPGAIEAVIAMAKEANIVEKLARHADLYNETALEIAVKRNCARGVSLLIDALPEGLACSRTAGRKTTALHIAEQMGHIRLADMLRGKCASNEVDVDGIKAWQVRAKFERNGYKQCSEKSSVVDHPFTRTCNKFLTLPSTD